MPVATRRSKQATQGSNTLRIRKDSYVVKAEDENSYVKVGDKMMLQDSERLEQDNGQSTSLQNVNQGVRKGRRGRKGQTKAETKKQDGESNKDFKAVNNGLTTIKGEEQMEKGFAGPEEYKSKGNSLGGRDTAEMQSSLEDTTDDKTQEDLSCMDQLVLEEVKAKQEADEAYKVTEQQGGQNKNEADGYRLPQDVKLQKLDHILGQAELFTSFLKEKLPSKGQCDLGNDDKETVSDKENQIITEDTDSVGENTKRKRSNADDQEKAKKARRYSIVDLTPDELPLFKGNLRDYQVVGVRWLISLYHNGVNGILADQMGLGKTIQTIAFISYLRTMQVYGPFMVVAPLSTLLNWHLEFAKFLPDQNTVVYHGTKEEREEIRNQYLRNRSKISSPDFPLFITSYEIIRLDRKYFQRMLLKYVVVDEGHKMKNHNSLISISMRQLNIDNALILTGTPLQNNVEELWSLLNFIMPVSFCSLDHFLQIFDFSSIGSNNEDIVQREKREQIVSKLHRILDPFVLRRVKQVATPDLPPKQDIVLYAPMTDLQIKMTKDMIDGVLLEKLEEETGIKNQMRRTLRNRLMQCRKIANHPDLILGDYDSARVFPSKDVLMEQCGKLQLLDRLLDKLFARGHKVLIFSQFVMVLDVLDTYLEEKQVKAGRLDGDMKFQDRIENVKQFQESDDMRVMLLSTRAGGLGINLTAADTVIVYDSDWNPQSDLQAQDRCHRIGQTKPVLVFRLATAHSEEIRILQTASKKLTLERLLIKDGKKDEIFMEGNKKLTEQELLDILRQDVELCQDSQQSAVSDQDLDRLLQRDYLGMKQIPFPKKGVGYELLEQRNVEI